MITRPIIFNYFNYKDPYYGSYHNMRFQITRSGEKPDFLLVGTTWPEPFCIEMTPDEQKVSQSFEFSEAGYDLLIEWLNERHSHYIVQ